MTIRDLAIILVWSAVFLLAAVLTLIRRGKIETPIAIGFWLIAAALPAIAGGLLLLMRHAAAVGTA